jgi:hypothetical protein
MDVACARFGGTSIFFAQDTTPIKPTKGMLNLPTLRLDDKFALRQPVAARRVAATLAARAVRVLPFLDKQP